MDTLESVDLFLGLAQAELRALRNRSEVRSYPKNTLILEEGGRSDSLYVMKSGRVRVYCHDHEGREITFAHKQRGDYFGELALLGEGVQETSVIALERSEAMVLARTELIRAMRRHPKVAANLVHSLARKVRSMTLDIKNLALLDVHGRVVMALINMGSPVDEGWVIDGRMSQQAIAHRVGASREHVCRILKTLEQNGFIQRERTRILIAPHLLERHPAGKSKKHSAPAPVD